MGEAGGVVDDIDEVGGVDDIDEADDVHEDDETGGVEDVHEADEAGGDEDVHEADEANEAGGVEYVHEADEADEVGGVEDVHEADEADEVGGVEDVHEADEAGGVEDVHEADDADEADGADEGEESEYDKTKTTPRKRKRSTPSTRHRGQNKKSRGTRDVQRQKCTDIILPGILDRLGLSDEPKLTSVIASIHKCFFNGKADNPIYDQLFSVTNTTPNMGGNNIEEAIACIVHEAWQTNLSFPYKLDVKESDLDRLPDTHPHTRRYLMYRRNVMCDWFFVLNGFRQLVFAYISALFSRQFTSHSFPNLQTAWAHELCYYNCEMYRHGNIPVQPRGFVHAFSPRSLIKAVVCHYGNLEDAHQGVQTKLATLSAPSLLAVEFNQRAGAPSVQVAQRDTDHPNHMVDTESASSLVVVPITTQPLE
jgi:hypothetical protein